MSVHWKCKVIRLAKFDLRDVLSSFVVLPSDGLEFWLLHTSPLSSLPAVVFAASKLQSDCAISHSCAPLSFRVHLLLAEQGAVNGVREQ
jgi:hypothetical protein